MLAVQPAATRRSSMLEVASMAEGLWLGMGEAAGEAWWLGGVAASRGMAVVQGEGAHGCVAARSGPCCLHVDHRTTNVRWCRATIGVDHGSICLRFDNRLSFRSDGRDEGGGRDVLVHHVPVRRVRVEREMDATMEESLLPMEDELLVRIQSRDRSPHQSLVRSRSQSLHAPTRAH